MPNKLLYLCLAIFPSVSVAQKLPDPAVSTTVSLSELLAYAAAHAPEVTLANIQVKKADAAIAAAKPKRPENPTIGLVFGPRQSQGQFSFDVEASLSQTFETNGERELRQKAASAASEVYLAEHDVAAWKVETKVRLAFRLALVAKQQVLASEQLLTFAETTLEISKKRQRAGDISALAVRLAESDILQVKQEKRATELAYQQARIQLAVVSGWPVATPPEPQGTLETPQKAASLSILLPIAIEEQPALKKNLAELNAAKAALALAEREAKPELVVGATLSQEAIGNSTNAQTLLLATLGVSLPTLQKNQGARAQASAEIAIALTEGELQKKALEAGLASSIASVNAAADNIATYNTEILPALESNLTLLQKSFTLGEIDMIQIGTARERFLQLQRDALVTYADYFIAVASLEAFLGEDSWQVKP